MKFYTISALVLAIAVLGGCTQQPTQVAPPAASLPPVDSMNIHMCLMGGGQDCAVILDPANKEKYGAAVQEQCTMMKGMAMCDKYFAQ